MVTVTNELGKKLTEQAGARRTLNIFGNDFNPFWSADFGVGSNFPIRINAGNKATTFAMNASPFPQPQHGGHEVVTVLTFIDNMPAGTTLVTQRWFNSDGDVASTQIFSATVPPGFTGDFWVFSFIGWKNPKITGVIRKELFKNSVGGPGSSRVEITLTGRITSNQTINFNVTDADPNPMKKSEPNFAGFLWVDDSSNELMYTDGAGYIHNLGIPISSSVAAIGAQPGFIWIPSGSGDHGKIAYTSTGLKHLTRKGAPENTLIPQSSTEHGYIWFEENNDFHANFISLIADDGVRYVLGDGAQDDF